MKQTRGLILLTSCLLSAAATAAEPDQVDFNQHVRAILSDRCYKCHGPDSENRQADLRLDQEEEALQARAGSGLQVILPGKPVQSEFYRRITSEDPDVQMPPPASKLELTPAEIEILDRWIKQGARWDGHWSFQPPQEVTLPEVVRQDWPRNAVDYFVLARLEAAGLFPAGQARREQLIRRLSFDLTGLPPTLAEIDQYLADTRPGSYGRLVDRLLASPAFGERVASVWLDLARYSDTYGYQVDRDRYVWPWRDWVIDAINRNQPYDQFITWQLAGDLLPDATQQQQLATAFNRLHPQKVEGGSTPEEFRVEYVADRNHTFATAFLGLTLECARCHDHKYDPITQRDYYQLFAYFNNIDEAGLYSYFTPSVPTPTLRITDRAMRNRLAANRESMRAEQDKLAGLATAQQQAFQQWLANRPGETSIGGQVAHLDFEGFGDGENKGVEGKVGKAVRLSGDAGVGTKVGNFRRSQPFTVACWIQTPDFKERAVIYHRSRAWTDAGSRGYQMLLEEGRLSASLIHFWPGNAIRVRTRAPIPLQQWLHVTMTYDGSSRAAGLKIWIDGQAAETEIVRDNLYKNISGGGGDTITIGERFRDNGFSAGLVDEFKVFDRQLTVLEISHLHDGKSLTAALAVPQEDIEEDLREGLKQFYLATLNEPYRAQVKVLEGVRQQQGSLQDGLTEIMTMEELEPRRQSHVLRRGAYDAPTTEVTPGTPAFLLSVKGLSQDRLGLSRWLTSPDHPLTGRVAVNRLWQMCFGNGLVATPEDFGSQGAAPSHPRLLDWLASEFVAQGWDVKKFIRTLVCSSTYRQKSAVPLQVRSLDPDNVLYSRGTSYQLSAEMIRDNALAASDLLVTRLGGPSVRPYEVAVSFKPVKQDSGAGLYRRSLYTYWKRTGPAPAMMALDASKRDICVVKRERTSSPVQALVLLNDPQLVEASRVLAHRLVAGHGEDIEGIVVEAFRRLTSRRPSVQETELLVQLCREQREHYAAHPDAATDLLATGQARPVGELPSDQVAAVTMMVNMLMNFDACVMKK
ncbi:MAG: DUF1553 domain-containing protein [Pirellulaceae bacterium]|nr:DUF1553 domain-containing protein [Pirellulaceae bacterium]